MKKVLFVCTGNTCRSPMAAAIYKNLHPCVSVKSCGICAKNESYSDNAVKALAEWGIDISGGFSQNISREDLDADIIFCMSESHKNALLGVGLPSERIIVLNVSDPFLGDIDVYRRCRDEIKQKLLNYTFTVKDFDITGAADAAKLEEECFSCPWSEDAIKESANANTKFFVAKMFGETVGYAGVTVVLDEAYVTNIAVSEDFRGFGIGTSLTNALKNYAKEKNCAFLSLEVRESNKKAINIYEKSGFETVGKRKNFYSAPCEDALIMTWVIKSENTCD